MPHEQDGAKSKQSLRFTIGAPVAKHQPQISTVDCGCNGLGIVGRTTNFLMTKEPARRDSGADGWMLGAAGAGGWSCAGRVRTVSKLKVRAGIILGPHAARTLSKLDLGMRTGTEAQSNAEEGGRAPQPHHRMALASSKADELGSRHSSSWRRAETRTSAVCRSD